MKEKRRTSDLLTKKSRMLKKVPASIESLEGKTLTHVADFSLGNGIINFHTDGGDLFKMESVDGDFISSVTGDWQDLLGTPLVRAEVMSDSVGPLCILSTEKSTVKVQWCGQHARFVKFVPME